MSKAFENQRTYALVGTGGCGKTSLAEMLLFQAGVVNRLGKIEDGTTVLDYEPEEIKRRGSTQPGFSTFEWKGNRHFLMDTPGAGNFVGDLSYLLVGADAALFVIDAVDGVRPLTRRLWKNVTDAGLPAMVVINKIDRDRADFDAAFKSITTGLHAKPVLLYMPIGVQSDFKGVVDVLNNKAYLFQNGNVTETSVPADMADDVTLIRETTIENIAESDDTLMEKYLEEGSLAPEEISTALKNGVLKRELVPVLVAASLDNKGGTFILDAIQELFPSPLDHASWLAEDGSERASSPDEAPALFIFKTLVDPFTGQLSVARVLSGTVNSDSSLKNTTTNEIERLGTLLYLNGKTQTPCKDTIGPGAIVAIAKLKNTHTADTLTDEKALFKLLAPTLPPHLISFALAAKEKGDEDKVFAAVNRLLDEDVCLKLSRNEDTGEILLYGMGQLHVEQAVEKAKRRSKVDILLKTPKVPYLETFKGKVQIQGRHKKQSGGRGQFGDCWVEFEGLKRGSGYVFEDAIVGGAIPRQYIPAVDKGIQEAGARGFLAGYPMVDFKAKLYDGSYHTVDSSEMAFKIAGSLALKNAMEKVKQVLLEPIMLLTVSIPDEYMGDVIGDLSSRRGKVLGSDSQSGVTEVKAHVPMSEILRYAPDLRSMTGGQGVFTMELAHYEEAPQPVVDKVVAENKSVAE